VTAASRPKADTVLNDILIYFIPHAEQRYDTCGDYMFVSCGYEDPKWANLVIGVSKLKDRREMLLVAIHELIEWALCDTKGITNEEIDEFDLNYAPTPRAVEPGDCLEAPYYKEHQIATGIERILAAEMGVDWLAYERHIEELSK